MMSVGVLKHIFQCVVVWVCGQAALVLNFGWETHARDRIFGWLSIYSEVAQGAMNICAYHTMCFSMPCESRGVLLHFLVINRSYFCHKSKFAEIACLTSKENVAFKVTIRSKGSRFLELPSDSGAQFLQFVCVCVGSYVFFVVCKFHVEITWVMHRGVW